MFFLSLNRCLCFVSMRWNERLFEKYHLVFPIGFSVFFSISGAIGIIETSEVERIYVESFGFIDTGLPIFGYRKILNGLYEYIIQAGFPPTSSKRDWLEGLAISNYFPEMILPFSLIIDSIDFAKLKRRLKRKSPELKRNDIPLSTVQNP
uniref:Photosystem I assembly protein Ycf4 n=1 Tax=Caenorhabditis tropicalis TaxID=1561998 RepID=A0A1I7TAP3_9PELO